MQDTFFKRHLMLATIFGSLLVVLGIYLMFQQESFVRIFISILGLFLVGSGVASLFALRTYTLGRRTKMATLIQALISIVLGLVAFIVPLSAANVSWTLLLYLIAIELIFSAIISFLDALLLRKSELPVSALLSEGVFSLVVAILLFVFPQQIGSMLLKLVGVVLIAMGLGMVLWSVRIRKINRQFSQTVIEAEAVVVDEGDD
ncbi:MAG: hypothetical protein EOM68_14680 [Spirochaetia bacterium]|jgi:uncharacterized membrane protein HdeD (DUF308 family)|nr:hypothetical protein [Spirochaetia bacterium]NLK06420.1 hypothetical protein [Spirochaetales bacterium]